ncbi:hypothetical protein Tco_0445381 [Tanacetum coccineum]
MKESKAYKTYYAFASGKEISKPKYVWPSTREKTMQAPKASPGQRLKTTAKVTNSGNKKLFAFVPKAKGLETLSEVALSKNEQMKIATKRSKTQFHSSHASGSGANKGTGKSNDEDDDDEVSMSKDDDDNADDEDDDNEQTESDNDGDDFVHPKFSTRAEEESQYEEDKEEECGNVEEENLDKEKINEEEEVNEMYRDVNVNLERRDTEMTDVPQTNLQATQVIEDTHVIITVVNPEV